MLVFTVISPHPPIILPSVNEMESRWKKRFISSPGSEEDRKKVKKTIESLEALGKKFVKANTQEIIISSPHPDWGFNVPLFFIAKDFKGKIKTCLMGIEEPEFYLEEGKRIYSQLDKNKRYALISSADLSHCLKEDGPYGFQPDGPKFDKELIESLKKKDIENILKLDQKYPQAAQCGLGSISFMLGILEAAGINWKAEILSYEGPFGVGYLVANFKV